MLRRVALVRTGVSEELSTSINRVTRIGELGTTLAVTSNRDAKLLIPENAILHSHRRENLKYYILQRYSVENKILKFPYSYLTCS
jgi:hypothetical protein